MQLLLWVVHSIQFLNVIVEQVTRFLSSSNLYASLQLVPVTNVTSCYLFELCDLCGRPPRGICSPEKNLSRCECLATPPEGSRPYTGEFCLPDTSEAPLSTSTPERWTPIVIGVLAGLAGLICAVTCCLLAVAVWRRRRRPLEE